MKKLFILLIVLFISSTVYANDWKVVDWEKIDGSTGTTPVTPSDICIAADEWLYFDCSANLYGIRWNSSLTSFQIKDDFTFYDGVGDSPAALWIGATNNDIVSMWLDDTAIATKSDFILQLPGIDDPDSMFEIIDGNGDFAFRMSSDGRMNFRSLASIEANGQGIFTAGIFAINQFSIVEPTSFYGSRVEYLTTIQQAKTGTALSVLANLASSATDTRGIGIDVNSVKAGNTAYGLEVEVDNHDVINSDLFGIYSHPTSGRGDDSNVTGIWTTATSETGSNSVAIGLLASATGGETNYAAYFGDGDVKVENNLDIDGDTSIAKTLKTTQGLDVASANDMTLGDGNLFDITGTTTINTIVTKAVGTVITLEFDGILQLTHSADLFLPTATNITTAAGDIASFYEYATGDWRCKTYLRADGSSLAGGEFGIETKYVAVTTYTAAGINTAIDALGADGGEVYLPEGNYVMTGSAIIIDYNNTTLTGAGAGTILDWSAGQGSDPAGIDTNDKTQITIRNIAFLGNTGGGDSRPFIGNNDDADYLTVENCWFTDGDYYSIWSSGQHIKILNSVFSNSDNVDVFLNDGYGLVDGNTIMGSGSLKDINVKGSYCIVSNNTILNSNFTAINVDVAITHTLIQGNFISGSARDAVKLTNGSDYSKVIGNTIYNTTTGFSDIDLDRSDHSTISGNILLGNGTSNKGIYLDLTTYCTVTGNFTDDHDVAGIQEDSDCANNLIAGNNVLDGYVLNGATPRDFIVLGGIDGPDCKLNQDVRSDSTTTTFGRVALGTTNFDSDAVVPLSVRYQGNYGGPALKATAGPRIFFDTGTDGSETPQAFFGLQAGTYTSFVMRQWDATAVALNGVIFAVQSGGGRALAPTHTPFNITHRGVMTLDYDTTESWSATMTNAGHLTFDVISAGPAYIEFADGHALPIATKTNDYTMTGSDYTILADGTSNVVTITLPAAATVSGIIYNIKAINTDNQVDVDPNASETIDGVSANHVISLMDNLMIQSSGVAWFIL